MKVLFWLGQLAETCFKWQDSAIKIFWIIAPILTNKSASVLVGSYALKHNNFIYLFFYERVISHFNLEKFSIQSIHHLNLNHIHFHIIK